MYVISLFHFQDFNESGYVKGDHSKCSFEDHVNDSIVRKSGRGSVIWIQITHPDVSVPALLSLFYWRISGIRNCVMVKPCGYKRGAYRLYRDQP